MGSPQDNDAWNAKFATKYGIAVIALNYGKAPKNAFPGPVHVSEVCHHTSILMHLADSRHRMSKL